MFEDEPDTKPGLLDCENAVIVPHIASASYWTRAGMVRRIRCQLQHLPQLVEVACIIITFPFGCSGSSSAPSSEHQAAAAVLAL